MNIWNIRENATGQEDDSTTGCLLDNNCFKKHFNLNVIDLSKNKHLMVIHK